MSFYGKCECTGHLEPVWFQEQETKVSGGMMVWTNRYRNACSHLVCKDCGKNHAVDDSFDGNWYVKAN